DSDVSYLDNLVLNQPTRRVYRHHITLFLAHQGAGDWRADRQLADFYISLVISHDLVGDLFVGLAVGDIHGGAENDLAGMGNGRDIDHDRMLQSSFDITNTRLDHTLLLARSMVLGVFLEIPQFTRRTDLLTEFRTHDLGQVSQFFFQGASALDGHRKFACHALIPAWRSCSRRTVFSGPNLSASHTAWPPARVVVMHTLCCRALRRME